MKNAKRAYPKAMMRTLVLLIMLSMLSAMLPGVMLAVQEEQQRETLPQSVEVQEDLSLAEDLQGTQTSETGDAVCLQGFEGEYALSDDSTPVSVIVLFGHEPSAVQVA